ncbi:hypothetical protein KR215_005575 [Drosophila sulfurigaster]|uniref:uncharacterized protein LOC132784772 isoform X1 n=1 Tax=Drosophila nasuta TaxID=42062 RepID=UPI00295EEEC6|nr:uncharacterized protein LOC132784772 isoform X1 [Drosophila nasuta]XP_060646593.1 uncharacterized protein LOC132784772 isoform X1 [Drosophila nasuta]XP_062126563.1 uncharacterized protein LOC133839189 isoform X1 [Drosophila sulfurigaster albostrigata]XP_062126564.1 uncharacterized protein LOC133839189 isoform X1 [Drosophila sulfurigaster albostrigata]KAH8403438.1 hypothetical protein KR215_005575 [Drosophila sulfurigaster]
MLRMQNMFMLLLASNMLLAVHASGNKKQQQQNQEIWEQDLSDTFKIEGSDQGIQKVNLKCGANSMNVMLETEKPFTGVMYTRGSFYKQTAPCFMKPTANQGTRTLEMNFQLDQCQTLKDGELYTNIVVIQNDPELITPGDSAFSLECDFRQPRSLDVEASMLARDRVATKSKITLTSPDPAAPMDNLHNSVFSNSDTVEYIPKLIKPNETIRLGTVEEVTLPLLHERDEL